MKAIKKVIIIIGFVTLILFSGCNSSYQDFKIDCKYNTEIQKKILNKSYYWHNGSLEDENKLERYCMELYISRKNINNTSK